MDEMREIGTADSAAIGGEDIILASRLAGGDAAALTQIVRKWEAPLGRYLSRFCGTCGGEREDILQGVFLRVYRRIHLYDPRLPFSAWIYRICRNEAISRHRGRRFAESTELPEDVSISLWGTMAALPDAPLCGSEIARQIREIVEAMPDKLREPFVLRFFEERSYAEIGDILEENGNTVATRIRRARELFVRKAVGRGLAEGGEFRMGRKS